MLLADRLRTKQCRRPSSHIVEALFPTGEVQIAPEGKSGQGGVRHRTADGGRGVVGISKGARGEYS